jgi:hypothetical protein
LLPVRIRCQERKRKVLVFKTRVKEEKEGKLLQIL